MITKNFLEDHREALISELLRVFNLPEGVLFFDVIVGFIYNERVLRAGFLNQDISGINLKVRMKHPGLRVLPLFSSFGLRGSFSIRVDSKGLLHSSSGPAACGIPTSDSSGHLTQDIFCIHGKLLQTPEEFKRIPTLIRLKYLNDETIGDVIKESLL